MKEQIYVEEGIPAVGYAFNDESANVKMPVKMVKVFNGRKVEDFFNEFQGKKIRITIEILAEDTTNG
ncbi:hypothetical protein [Alkalihalobacillus sp. TS-13]|uniref:hypothetical protein n=1 Tax=Alkalihalobacillus sp. TS-13 TaxID=2842455 RepID=UPI001C88C206|nr:hypothetical protein [Alkalihalobacillus sp. TS-13]